MQLRILLLPIVIVLFSASAFSQTATVTGQDAFLRGTPSDTGAVVDTLVVKSTVHIIKQTGDWCLVQSFPFVGWVHRTLLRVDDTLKTDPGRKTEPVSSAQARNVSDSSTEATPAAPTSLTAAPDGQRVYIRGPRGGCYYLREGVKKIYVAHRLCS